ncbi:MAG: glycosyltransferase family 1 protein [Anaerolineae bacterium]|nr:glycosyltransferase family 1 protein [Gloeobacterales cyanobacterium ES-bin-313]
MSLSALIARKTRTHLPTIAMISEHGDPAADIGREEAGGQNVYVRQVGEALAELGYRVDMFTRQIDPEQPVLVQHTPRCRTIRLKAGPLHAIPRDELFAWMGEFVDSFRQFQRQEGQRYSLIHSHYWMSGWAAMQLKADQKAQLVHTYHSLGAIKYGSVDTIPQIARTRLAVERQILEQVHCVVATSPQEQDQLRALVSRRGTIEVIPCGTDLRNFRVIPKQEARRQLGLPLSEPIILYVGRFDPRKGIETLVRACSTLQNHARLMIVGGSDPEKADGLERKRIEAIVEEIGLREQTQFVGQVGHDRLPLYYAAADVCVVPSHYEPFGLVAIEAMACGTPVIASAVGGLVSTVVPEITGLLAPPRDVPAFRAAIDRVLGNRQWAQQMGEQGSLWVGEHFNWPRVATQLDSLYRSLSGSGKILELPQTSTASFL